MMKNLFEVVDVVTFVFDGNKNLLKTEDPILPYQGQKLIMMFRKDSFEITVHVANGNPLQLPLKIEDTFEVLQVKLLNHTPEWKECRLLVDGTSPDAQAKVKDFREAHIEALLESEQRTYFFRTAEGLFPFASDPSQTIDQIAPKFTDWYQCRTVDLIFHQNGFVLSHSTRLFDLSADVPIDLSTDLVWRLCSFQGRPLGKHPFGKAATVASVRQNAESFIQLGQLPRKMLHIAKDTGVLRPDVSLSDFPGSLNFILTDTPLVFVRAGEAVIDYAFPLSRTVGEAKAELRLNDLVQNNAVLDDLQRLNDISDDFDVIGIPRTGEKKVKLTIVINDCFFETFELPYYSSVGQAKRVICERFAGLTLGDFDFVLGGRTAPSDDVVVPGDYRVVCKSGERQLTFVSDEKPFRLSIDILKPIFEVQERIASVVQIEEVQLFVRDVRMKKFWPFCVYDISGAIRVMPKSRPMLHTRMSDGLSESLRVSGGARQNDEEMLEEYREVEDEGIKKLNVLVDTTQDWFLEEKDERTVEEFIAGLKHTPGVRLAMFENNQQVPGDRLLRDIEAEDVIVRVA
jgi:hypothetical protein